MKKITFFIFTILSASIVLPEAIFAQGIKKSGKVLDYVAGKSGITKSDLGSIVGGTVGTMLTLVGMIFLVLMVYAGYLWMTARAEEEQVKKAQKIISASVIGLVIVVSAYAITIFVTGRFGAF